MSVMSGEPRMRYPERGIVLLRIVVGLWFVKSFVTKLGVVWVGGLVPLPGANPRWLAVMPKLLARYAEGNPIDAYRQFLVDTVLPNGRLFAHLTAVGETAVGIGLTLGLLTVLASAIGLCLVSVYGLATFWQGASQQGFHLLLATSLLVFIGVRAGREWGIDRWIVERRPRSLPARLLLGLAFLVGGVAAPTPAALAQPTARRPMLVLADFAFEGRAANSIQPGDSAMAKVATAGLRDALKDAESVALADSSRVAVEMARSDRPGIRCSASVSCAREVGERLGATWLVTGRVSKISNLIWYLSGQLVDVNTGKVVQSEDLELKGGRDDMVPRGAVSLARRIVGAAGAAAREARPE